MYILTHTDFYIHLNEDLFLFCLSFLNNCDLTKISQVCKKWKECSYECVLWRRLDLSKYSDGSHDYLLKHILMKDAHQRFNDLEHINLENCSALTDESLFFISCKCPYLRILLLTNCYRLSPKSIYLTVQKLPYLHKLELYGVISTHNKYYHMQQLQQLTYFLNELGIHSPAAQPNNNQNNMAPQNDQNNENNENEQNMQMQNAQNVANQGDDANVAANPAAPPNNAQNEANIADNAPSLNNRIQRVRLMICLAKSIKNCRPWMDLGLFWMQILSMVGRRDPLMILDIEQYENLYSLQNEMGNEFFLHQQQQQSDNFDEAKEEFHGARYLTVNEYKLNKMRQEMQQQNNENMEEKKDEIDVEIDTDFELAPDHEWMRSLQSPKKLIENVEMDTFKKRNENEKKTNFYPPKSTDYFPLIDDESNNNDKNGLFARRPLRVEKLCKYFVNEYDETLPPNLSVASCRYFGRFRGGCWGKVIGRIVYSNCEYAQHGNYPCEVLFSCEAHSNEDFTDDLLDKCQSCERLFRKESMMKNALICKTCFDSKKLQEKCIWVNLNKTGLKNFNFSHVCQYTLNVADRRNLPKTLKSYGRIRAELTYDIAQNDDENDGDDDNDNMNDLNVSKIPIYKFWQNNEVRISSMMDKFRKTLQTAQSGKATRAILVYSNGPSKKEQNGLNVNDNANAIEHERKQNENDNDADDADVIIEEAESESDSDENGENHQKYIEILADPGVLFDGLDGVDYVFLTVSAWTQFYSILCPILFSLLCTLYFLHNLTVYNYNAVQNSRSASTASSNAIYLPDAPNEEKSSSMYLFYALGAFIILISGAFIAYRFQRKCEQIFRLFLVGDIFLILSIGFAILCVIVAINLNLSMDFFSFWLFVYNFGVIGVMTFYCAVPPLLHRMFLVILNCIMSIMITSAIEWYVLFLLLILVCADVIAMIKPSFGRMFSPFLVPTQIQLPNTTPRIFYQVYGLRVRAPEFMFYGLMLGLIQQNEDDDVNGYYTQVVLLLITVLSGFVISVFVMPFFSKQIRPLPISFALLLVSIGFYKQIFRDYQDQNVWSLVAP